MTPPPTDLRWRMGPWTDERRIGRAVDRQRFLLARRWVRELADEAPVIAWPGFAPTPPGARPSVAPGGDADFNVSHSGRHLLVAVTDQGAIGVDLEVAPFEAFDRPGLQRRMCSPAELEVARHLQPSVRRRYLARLWSAKEALTKLTGQGLSTDFRSIEPSVDVPSPNEVGGCEAHIAWQRPGGAVNLARLDAMRGDP